jgi:hypothetical protein
MGNLATIVENKDGSWYVHENPHFNAHYSYEVRKAYAEVKAHNQAWAHERKLSTKIANAIENTKFAIFKSLDHETKMDNPWILSILMPNLDSTIWDNVNVEEVFAQNYTKSYYPNLAGDTTNVETFQ